MAYQYIIVTGTLSPDATGEYVFYGQYGGKDYYRRPDGAYFVFWDADGWVISELLGFSTSNYWLRMGTSLFGTYDAQGDYEGTATVSNWITPTSDNSAWINNVYAWDENLESYAYTPSLSPGDTSFRLVLSHSAINCNILRVRAASDGDEGKDISLWVWVYYNGDWHFLDSNVTQTETSWTEVSLGGTYSVTALGFEFYNDSEASGSGYGKIYEVDFGEVTVSKIPPQLLFGNKVI